MSGSDKLPITKEELDAIIAEAKAEAKAEHEAEIAMLTAAIQNTVDTAASARTEHEAEIAKLNATLQHTVDTAATDTGSRNLQLVRENEMEQSKNFLDNRLFDAHKRVTSLLMQLVWSIHFKFNHILFCEPM